MKITNYLQLHFNRVKLKLKKDLVVTQGKETVVEEKLIYEKL